MLSHTSLGDYYYVNFVMAQHHKYSLEELDNLIPFEKDIYYTMLIEFLKKKEEQDG